VAGKGLTTREARAVQKYLSWFYFEIVSEKDLLQQHDCLEVTMMLTDELGMVVC